MNKTFVFDKDELINANVKSTLKEIVIDLEERGYNPIKQITGYLLSGDPGYISNYKECRNRITKFETSDIIETLLKEYLK